MPNLTVPLPFPARNPDAHKGDFGRVLLLGGSRGMSGAIALSAMAALKTGSGLVVAGVPDRCLETVASFHPGMMTMPFADTPDGQFAPMDDSRLATLCSQQDAIGCGPGMRTEKGAAMIVRRLLDLTRVGRVLDADALNILAEKRLFQSPTLEADQRQLILTPHPGELQRLTGAPAQDRAAQIQSARELVERFGLTVVVKGSATVVVGRDTATGKTVEFANQTGNAGMATAGSGDVLTGIITSLLGQGLATIPAARLGVFLHGLAGDLAARQHSQAGLTCRELLDAIPQAILSMR